MASQYYNTDLNSSRVNVRMPEYDTSGLLKAGQVIGNSLDYWKNKDIAEQERLAEVKRDEYRISRDMIADARQEKADARQEKKDKRLDLETASQDLYKNELFKGQQTKGGSYGDALATESSKYDLTTSEQTNMQKYFANGMYDTNAMRKSGDNVLADKIDWQNKVSNNVGSFIESGVGKESRPEMYDRIGSILESKGYIAPESLIASADQARLSEAKSAEEKLKDIETQRADILKRNREDNWKLVNASGGKVTYDEDGNEIQTSARTANNLRKDYKSEVDANNDAVKITREAINSLDKIDPLKKTDAINQVNSVINAVAARGVRIDEAARMVTGELTQKGDKSWFFEKFNPDINQKAIDIYSDQLIKNMPKKQNVTYGGSNDGASKFDLASELVAQNKTSDAESLAKLNNDKAKLLAGEETRRTNRIDEWLKSQGLKSSEPVKSNNIDSIQTKTPGSESSYADKVRKSEGKYDSVNNKSGALGAYQFLPSTLEGLKKQTGEKFSNEDFLANPKLQDKYFNLLTKSNAGRIEALGLEPTSMNLYIAHNLGPGYVKEMQELNRNPSAGLQKALNANNLNSKEEWYKRNKKYADIDSNIKDSNIKKEDWIIAQNYFENNGGMFDRNKNITDISRDKGIGRKEAEKYYDEVVKPEVDALKKSLKPKFEEDEIGGVKFIGYEKLTNPESSGSKSLSLKERIAKNKQDRIDSQENANLLRRIKESNVDASQEEPGLEHSNLDVFPIFGGKAIDTVSNTVSKFIPNKPIAEAVEVIPQLKIESDRAKYFLPDLNIGRGNSTVNNGLSIPNYNFGQKEWVNKSATVATDKMNGRGVYNVIDESSAKLKKLEDKYIKSKLEGRNIKEEDLGTEKAKKISRKIIEAKKQYDIELKRLQESLLNN